jgi:flagellar motor protein MotB
MINLKQAEEAHPTPGRTLMRRRELLMSAAAITASFAGRTVFGQACPGQRAAVVIGVNRASASNLPILKAAVSGAEEVSDWLMTQNFDVKLFTDKNKPVKTHEIIDAIRALVECGTITELVVYFSGHGFVNNYAEHWLLSEAPDVNQNEAVNLYMSWYAARWSGISNVIFISDACRSTINSLGATSVIGQCIFPPKFKSPSDVDQFLATRVGNPAWEVNWSESVLNYQAIYTASFLSAFVHPTEDMIATVDGVKVVPNRKLKDYLDRDVPKRAHAKSITLEQHPESLIVCRDTIYIGRVSAAAAAAAPPPPPQAIVTIQDVANDAIAGAHGGVGPVTPERGSATQIANVALKSGFLDAQQRILAAQTHQLEQVETKLVLPSDVLFPSGGYQLSSNGKQALNQSMQNLQNPSYAKIVVNGYTDNKPIGPALQRQGISDSLVLSTRQASAVATFLESKGVNPNIISARGFGDTHPVGANDTPGGRAQNRRIEIALVPVQERFETGIGFSISGARVTRVAATSGIRAEILNPGDGDRPTHVEIKPENRRAGSVALQFADGSGTVVAALANFVGTVAVQSGRVMNVSYVPAQNSDRWSAYQRQLSDLNRLRAAVAVAAKFGAFRVQNESEAARLAAEVRVEKWIDPTLGIYAAYAYDQAGIHDQVRSVSAFMREDLGTDIFDVAMLSDNLTGSEVDAGRVAPFCPTLSQGWNLIKLKQIHLSPVVTEAGKHLVQALWTTFDRDGMDIIMNSNLWG